MKFFLYMISTGEVWFVLPGMPDNSTVLPGMPGNIACERSDVIYAGATVKNVNWAISGWESSDETITDTDGDPIDGTPEKYIFDADTGEISKGEM
ncbi:MAG: hypothetical protein GY757_08750 [bacterium]|nr:hypothetical protein [bacterium]